MRKTLILKSVNSIVVLSSFIFVMEFGVVGCNGGTPVASYKLYGIDFSPYENDQDPGLGSRISENQIRERLGIIVPYTKWIKTYASTNGLENTGRIAREFNLKTAVGTWLSSNTDANQQEMANLITAAKAGYVDLAVVGSEVLLRGDLTEAQLLSYINQFKEALPNVLVTTGEEYHVLLNHPNVIVACDVVFANFYPFWDGDHINNAIATVDLWYHRLADIASGKEVLVSETGWPSGGNQLGDAVPSLDTACSYFLNFVSWARAENVKYFYFEAFDESWKANSEGTVGPKWGVFDKDGHLKVCMQNVFDGQTISDNWSCQLIPGGTGTPLINLTFIPPIGSLDNLRGNVLHVDPRAYNIVVYIKVNDGWWIKPSYKQPSTTINCDGTWSCDITTGDNDNQASEIAVYLVPASYNPPLTAGTALDTVELNAGSVAQIDVTR